MLSLPSLLISNLPVLFLAKKTIVIDNNAIFEDFGNGRMLL